MSIPFQLFTIYNTHINKRVYVGRIQMMADNLLLRYLKGLNERLVAHREYDHLRPYYGENVCLYTPFFMICKILCSGYQLKRDAAIKRTV